MANGKSMMTERREFLVEVAVEWLDAVPEHVAAHNSEEELVRAFECFLNGSGGAGPC